MREGREFNIGSELEEGFIQVIEEGIEALVGQDKVKEGIEYRGPRYLVIPRSCVRVSKEALYRVQSDYTGGMVLCIYRGSVLEGELRGTGLNYRVIDSIEEVESRDYKSQEYYLYNLLDLSYAVDMSKRVIYKLVLEEDKVDLDELGVGDKVDLGELGKVEVKDYTEADLVEGNTSVWEKLGVLLRRKVKELGLKDEVDMSSVGDYAWVGERLHNVLRYEGKRGEDRVYIYVKDTGELIYKGTKSLENYRAIMEGSVALRGGVMRELPNIDGLWIEGEVRLKDFNYKEGVAGEVEVYGEEIPMDYAEVYSDYTSGRWVLTGEYKGSGGMLEYIEYTDVVTLEVHRFKILNSIAGDLVDVEYIGLVKEMDQKNILV